MRVFVAGASGVIGRQLLPVLVDAGHEVVGMTRSQSKQAAIGDAGARPIIADALDPEGLTAALLAAAPEVVVHELTAIPAAVDPRRFAADFAPTNRLRREGTRNLVSAAIAAGTRRIVVESIAQAYAPVGGWVKTETDPLYSDAPEVFRDTFQAVIALEAAVAAAGELEGVVLRYGNFYGPGTAYAADGSIAELVRARRFPLAGEGCGRWSFAHVADAARATLLAVQGGDVGVYNVVDDEPAAVSDWLPLYARALGAPAPLEVGPPSSPYGRFGMLEARGAANAKARSKLGWTPGYASWREGFVAELAQATRS